MCAQVHVVQEGKANNIVNLNDIKVGQKLTIPA